MPCYSPLRGFKNAETGGLVFKRQNTEGTELEVACGQCLGCRLDHSRMWAARLVHEASMHTCNHFVTLTYRPRENATDEQLRNHHYLPDDWSLKPRDFQLFMKRLRKKSSQALKYFHCGEYGNICRHGFNLEEQQCPLCNVGRPHYHAIIFNLECTDLYQYGETKDGDPRYSSPFLEDVWQKGFVDVGSVTFQSAAYVARYILKKVTGENSPEHYSTITDMGELVQVEPEYATMSNGIGAEWYEKFRSDIWPSDEVPVPGHGVIKKVPRYYEEKLKQDDLELLEQIKQQRIEFRQEHAEEYSPERLFNRYRVKKAQTANLKRDTHL